MNAQVDDEMVLDAQNMIVLAGASSTQIAFQRVRDEPQMPVVVET